MTKPFSLVSATCFARNFVGRLSRSLKPMLVLVLAAGMLIGFSAKPVAAQVGMTFTLEPITISNGNFVFDVMVAAAEVGTKLGDTQVYIGYNTVGFGSSIVANGKVQVTLGSLVAGPGYELVNVVDNTSSKVSITTGYRFTGTPESANDVPTTPTQLLRIEIEIADSGESAGLGFDALLMTGQQTSFDNTPYSPVDATDVDNSSLPVELTRLEAVVQDDAVLIHWSTASEINNAGFAIEHRGVREGETVTIGDRGSDQSRIDDKTSGWKEIAFVPGSGSSAEERQYTYRVAGLAPGRHQFRLRSVDLDGSYTLSPTIESSIILHVPFVFSPVYPNPIVDAAQFALSVQVEQRVRVTLVDVLGRQVRVLLDGHLKASDQTTVRIDGAGLSNGTYFVFASGQTFSETRMVVLRR